MLFLKISFILIWLTIRNSWPYRRLYLSFIFFFFTHCFCQRSATQVRLPPPFSAGATSNPGRFRRNHRKKKKPVGTGWRARRIVAIVRSSALVYTRTHDFLACYLHGFWKKKKKIKSFGWLSNSSNRLLIKMSCNLGWRLWTAVSSGVVAFSMNSLESCLTCFVFGFVLDGNWHSRGIVSNKVD